MSISPHSAIPTLAIKREGDGWMVTCSAGDLERYCERRPGADRVAQDHARTHGGKR